MLVYTSYHVEYKLMGPIQYCFIFVGFICSAVRARIFRETNVLMLRTFIVCATGGSVSELKH